MEQRYIRNLGALTEAECQTLRGKKVLVAGCGGLGGHIIDMLLRLGVGSIVAVDGDRFEASNLNRQLLSQIPLLGESKAKAAAAHAALVNPGVHFRPVEAFIDESNAVEIISGCDAVLDALDNISARKILSQACAVSGIPLIHGAIRGWTTQAAVSIPGDGVIERLYPNNNLISDKSALSFTPASCAAMQVSLCTKLLCGRAVETGKLYCFDLLNMEFETVVM